MALKTEAAVSPSFSPFPYEQHFIIAEWYERLISAMG